MHWADRLPGEFEAIAFDLDGTLVDTMPLHHAAYAEVFDAMGLHLSWHDYMALVGPPAREVISRFVVAAGGDPSRVNAEALHMEKKAAFERLLASRRPRRLPAADLLELSVGHVPCALVTSGNRSGTHAILAAMGWTNSFDAVVTGEDVTNGKPDPEPYHRAAALLGVSPSRCAVLEDTAAGLASGRSAGMTAFDVSTLADCT